MFFQKLSENAILPLWDSVHKHYILRMPKDFDKKISYNDSVFHIDLNLKLNLPKHYKAIVSSKFVNTENYTHLTHNDIIRVCIQNSTVYMQNKSIVNVLDDTSIDKSDTTLFFAEGSVIGFLQIFEEVQPIQPLKVKLLSSNATVPKRAHLSDAGYDLYSAMDSIIPPNSKALIKTDISVAIPEGWYGRIAPRSSVAWKYHIDVGAGVVDSHYRGPVGVVLFNLNTHNEFEIKKGDRIAQLILEKCANLEIVVVDDLDKTQRGEGGFGSTGK